MKLSVSVPDDLWKAARTVIGSDSPSEVVQEALRRAARAGVGYTAPPALPTELQDTLIRTQERLREEVRGLYEGGYRRGVELASNLTWQQLSWLARLGLVAGAEACRDVATRIAAESRRGASGLPPDARPMIDPAALVEDAGRHADPTHHIDWTPMAETVEGIDRALRDVRDQVRSLAVDP